MKKFIVFLAAVALCLSLAACSNVPFVPVTADPAITPAETSAVSVTPVLVLPEDTESPAAPEEDSKQNEIPEEPTEEPVEEPVELPDFAPIQVDVTLDYDLDGDGNEETVVAEEYGYETPEDYEGGVRISVFRNGTLLDRTELDYYTLDIRTRLIVDDLTAADSCKEIYFSGDAGSDDFVTYVLRLVEDKLVQFELWGRLQDVTEGTVTTLNYVDMLGTYSAVGDWKLTDNDTLTLAEPAAYTIEHTEADYPLAVLNAMPVRFAEGDAWTDGTLESGARFRVDSTDGRTWGICTTEDGRTFKVVGSRSEEEWTWMIAGKAEETWIAGIMYSG